MKDLLMKVEEMNKIIEELNKTKQNSLEQGIQLAVKKINTLYKLLKPYSEIAKLIPDYAASYDIITKSSKQKAAYISYHRNGRDWHIMTSPTGTYSIDLDQKNISLCDYQYYAVKDDFIQNINEEEIIKKVKARTMEMMERYITGVTREINDYNTAFEKFKTQNSTTTITNILESLFDANNQYIITGNSELVEIISNYISTLEDIIKGDE